MDRIVILLSSGVKVVIDKKSDPRNVRLFEEFIKSHPGMIIDHNIKEAY